MTTPQVDPVARVRALYDQRLMDTEHHRWSSFGRELVGELFDEIDRLRARVAELERQVPSGGEGGAT